LTLDLNKKNVKASFWNKQNSIEEYFVGKKKVEVHLDNFYDLKE